MKKLLALIFFVSSSAFATDTLIKNGRLSGTLRITGSPTPGRITYDAGSKFDPRPTVAISALDIDWSASQTFSKTLAANSTFTISNTTAQYGIEVAITNTAGNFTVTWPATVLWPGGSQPVQTVGAKTDLWRLVKIGASIFGSVTANYTSATPTATPTATATATASPAATATATATATFTPTATPTATATATSTATATATATAAATPSSPSDIAGLKLWLKADALGLSNNDPVGTWTDSSGTSNSAVQATSGKKPLFKTSIINSLPVVRFDGTDDGMTFPNNPGEPTSTFVVAAINVAPGSLPAYSTFVITSPANSGLRMCARLTSTNWGSFANAADFSSGEALTSGTFYILELTASPSSSILYRRGVQKATTANSIYGSGTTNTIGMESNANYLNGDIAEVIIYDSVLSSVNRAAVETYLQNKYGL